MKQSLSYPCSAVRICGNTSLRLLCCLFLTSSLVGCASPGSLVARQEKDEVPKMGVAPTDGIYGLFIAGQQQSMYEVSLKKGQPIGFESGEDGVIRWLYGTAGVVRNRLDVTQIYEWRLQQ